MVDFAHHAGAHQIQHNSIRRVVFLVLKRTITYLTKTTTMIVMMKIEMLNNHMIEDSRMKAGKIILPIDSHNKMLITNKQVVRKTDSINRIRRKEIVER